MTLYSYVVTVDTGFAPNPFHGVCTLACCKPDIRRTAKEGDYVVGLGPRHLGNRVVYAMQVTETLDLNSYWHDERFRNKRPDIEARREKAVGDNIYHRDTAGGWQQARSQHSHENGQQDRQLTRIDTNGENVLIGRDFIYWGGDGPPLPYNLEGLIVKRKHRSKSNEILIPDFIEWFEGQNERGCLGLPTEGLDSPSRGRMCKRNGKSKPRKRC